MRRQFALIVFIVLWILPTVVAAEFTRHEGSLRTGETRELWDSLPEKFGVSDFDRLKGAPILILELSDRHWYGSLTATDSISAGELISSLETGSRETSLSPSYANEDDGSTTVQISQRKASSKFFSWDLPEIPLSTFRRLPANPRVFVIAPRWVQPVPAIGTSVPIGTGHQAWRLDLSAFPGDPLKFRVDASPRGYIIGLLAFFVGPLGFAYLLASMRRIQRHADAPDVDQVRTYQRTFLGITFATLGGSLALSYWLWQNPNDLFGWNAIAGSLGVGQFIALTSGVFGALLLILLPQSRFPLRLVFGSENTKTTLSDSLAQVWVTAWVLVLFLAVAGVFLELRGWKVFVPLGLVGVLYGGDTLIRRLAARRKAKQTQMEREQAARQTESSHRIRSRFGIPISWRGSGDPGFAGPDFLTRMTQSSSFPLDAESWSQYADEEADWLNMTHYGRNHGLYLGPGLSPEVLLMVSVLLLVFFEVEGPWDMLLALGIIQISRWLCRRPQAILWLAERYGETESVRDLYTRLDADHDSERHRAEVFRVLDSVEVGGRSG